MRFKDSTILAALDTAWNAANNVTDGLVALAADVVGIAQHGVVYTGGTGKIAEHAAPIHKTATFPSSSPAPRSNTTRNHRKRSKRHRSRRPS